MRELTTHRADPAVNEPLQVFVMDEPGSGGANHSYEVAVREGDFSQPICKIKFQTGGVADKGVNGLTNEVLLAVVQDRLEGFQKGEFACAENLCALGCVQAALMVLQSRTRDRIKRGVEGKEIK